MSKLSNTITLLRVLQNGRKYSIKELSEIIEVSPRMIIEYKNELEYAGIFILLGMINISLIILIIIGKHLKFLHFF